MAPLIMADRISFSAENGSLLTIPCHWNKQVIEEIIGKDASKGIRVGEVYGVLADGGPVGHGRSRTSVVEVSRDSAADFRQFLTEKDLRALEGLVQFGNKHGVEVEMMATESCLLHCSMRKAHYEYLAREIKDGPFHTTCNARKLTNPREFLLAGGVIRPEDMGLYVDMGVKYFKLTGRSKPAEWLVEVANAYVNRGYDGNLIRLLGIDPGMKAEDWIYLSNNALDGFLEGFPKRGSYEERCQYCDQWMIKLHQEGNFRLMDGSNYRAEGNTLVLNGQGGEKVCQIIFRERGY